MRLPCLSFALFLLALLSSAVRAEVALDEEQRLRLFGDVRLRWEQDWDSSRDDGTRREDRDRVRVRLRLGLRWEPVEHLGLLARLRTGNTDSQQSPHVTVWQDEGDEGDGDVLIDRLHVEGKWAHGHVRAGRIGSPFWRQSETQFDDDIWFDGIGFGLRFGDGRTKQQVNGAFAAVPEGTASLSWDEQGWLSGLQYVVTREFGESRSFTASLSGLRIEDDESVANPVLQDLDWTIWTLGLQGKLPAGPVPLQLGASLFLNSDAAPKGTWNRGERTGWELFVRLGGLSKKGDWTAGLHYAHVEAFALVPFLAGDDWMRWGSATQTRATNHEGLELRAGYAFSASMNLLARLYLVDGLELRSPTSLVREDGKRFRIDFNWRF